MVNKLLLAKRVQILSMFVAGSSMRSISRVADVSINTVSKLLTEAGEACAAHHDAAVVGVKAKRIQCNEIWSCCYAKNRNVETAKATSVEAGDLWTWTALDADSKLIVSFFVGGRDAGSAHRFMQDVAGRLANRVRLTTDAHKAYLDAIEDAFGGDIDYAKLVKLYGEGPASAGRYSPGVCIGAKKERIMGAPDRDYVATPFVERENLTMRMHMRCFTWLTNAFSKKALPHLHMVCLYAVWYNFVRIHKTVKCSPAVAAGLNGELWEMEDILALIDARTEAPKARGVYKPRQPKVNLKA